ILLWGGLLYIVEMVTQRFKRTRYLLEGKPAIVIHKGTIMRDVMKKNRIDIGELQHLLRDKSVFSIQEVEYAILETKDRKSTRLNSSHVSISYAVFCLKKKNIIYINIVESHYNIVK